MTGYVRLRSWHADDPDTPGRTLCGRGYANHPVPAHLARTFIAQGYSRELPMDEKSCETCLRILANREGKA